MAEGCTTERRSLSLFVPGPAPHATSWFGPLPLTWRPRAGGHHARLELPLAVSTVTLSRGTARATVRLKPAERPPVVAQAMALRRRDAPRARALVDAALARAQGPERAALLGALGRLQHDAGDHGAAHASLRAAVAAHLGEGHPGRALRDAAALAVFLVFDEHAVAAAHAELGRLRPQLPAADQRAFVDYYYAYTAYNAGDARTALRRLKAIEPLLDRHGDSAPMLAVDVPDLRASVLRSLGQHAAGLDALRLARARARSACQQARIANNIGWHQWRLDETARLAGERPDAAVALGALDAALPHARACFSPQAQADLHLNRVFALLAADQLDAAAEALAAARAASPEAGLRQRLWALDAEARLQTAQGDAAAALATWTRLGALAERASVAEAAWRAALGRGEALASLGQRAAAADAFLAAEGLLDDQLEHVAAGSGRDTFLGDRERGTRRALDVLLELDRSAEALTLARRAQARLLRRLQRADRIAALPPAARATWTAAMARFNQARRAAEAASARAWRAPKDERAALRAEAEAARERAAAALDAALAVLADRRAAAPAPPPPNTVLLVYHRLPRGWAAFAAHGETVRAVRLTSAEAPLAPFDAEIAAAAQVAVIATGALRDVAFHALPWRGRPLLAHAPVIYPLDLGPSAGSASGPALVIGDPDESLPQAAAEARTVHAALRRQGPATHLAGRAATPRAVSAALATAGHLHYAGHGEYGGRGGWDSALRLADRGRLTVGDILAAEQVPATVVLSGCETGKSGRGHAGASVGLGQAFVAAGAAAVLATDRAVSDTLARAVAEALYARLPHAPLAQATREALLSVAAQQPDADWSAYRVWVR